MPNLATGIQVKVNFKRTTRDVEIDMSKLTWKDAKKLRKYQTGMQDGTLSEDESIELLDDIVRKITGEEPDDLPSEVMNKVIAALFNQDAQAEASEGN